MADSLKLKLMGWATSAESIEAAKKVREARTTYPSIKVVGRGTVTVEPRDIRRSEGFNAVRIQAKRIVNG